ncbi:gamma-tubulin complex component 3 homolog [Palaemon carinicauda]|uniref:gamma-tubulin complex component 3 homolog n=1 Tax=Palaemon carinicauda TaxID=392227 RepID=UPI0035B6494C
MDASGNLLRRLCSHVTGINDQRLDSHFTLAVTLLNDSGSSSQTKDHNEVADKIKRRLVREERFEDAVRFSGLLNKLLKSAVLQNKGSILALFLALSNDTAASRRLKIGVGNAAMTNGHLDDESFPLPKLYVDKPLRAPTVPENQSQATCERMEGANSRVWHLAERYRTAATAQPNSPFAELQQLHKSGLRMPAEKLPLKQIPRKNLAKIEGLVEVSERDLVRDLLYVFVGIEGKIIKKNKEKDGYEIDAKVKLSPSQKVLVFKLTEVGWLYRRVKSFSEGESSSRGSEMSSNRMVSGLVHQSLVVALLEHLSEFARLITLLERQIQESGDTPLSEASEGLTLRKLFMWTFDPRSRLKTLAFLVDDSQMVHGGACISKLYQHLHHGDPAHRKVVGHIIARATVPIFGMLTQWLLDGKLEDPHLEFFIAADPMVSDDKLWHDKYSIRWPMLPSFITKLQAEKILASGKSLNFLRNVCHFNAPIAGREVIKAALQQTTVESLFTQDDNGQLDDLITLTFRETSRHVLEEILTQHKFMTHLRALRRYLLLGQGDFVRYLMEILSPELNKPASNLYPHNLSSLLETAVAASNAQYEEPDILKRLDVRLLEVSAGDIGWDVFSLHYHVDGPIGTVFTADCMSQYLMLFNALWKDKRMEMMLSNIWKEQAATSKMCRDIPELGKALHHIQLLTTEIIHLVHQMEYYMAFEVMECSWHGLMTKLKSAQSLDDVIAAHNEFLKRIVAGSLLDKDSKHLRTHLRSVYNLIEKLKCLQERLSSAVVAEVNARKSFKDDIKVRTEAGEFGISGEHQELEKKRRKEFSKVIRNFVTDLEICTRTYQTVVKTFLLMLTQHDDQNLHLLSTRLDFNLYYHQRDHHLNQRLTYQHKRKSLGTSFTQ